jgi:hypothetical protein
MKSQLRVVEGYREGNVTFVFPEGNILRWDLLDWQGQILIRRLPIGDSEFRVANRSRSGKILRRHRDELHVSEALVLLGLIPDGQWVECRFDDGEGEEIAIINTQTDEMEFCLKKSPNK